jgi:hypothetical protein
LEKNINLLNTELNPMCHLLALLGAHSIRHVSRIRVSKDTGLKLDILSLSPVLKIGITVEYFNLDGKPQFKRFIENVC